MSNPKTPAERKAEAREALTAAIDGHGHGYKDNHDDDVCAIEYAIDAYARACIDEAVAPALERIDELRNQFEPIDEDDMLTVRKLLTERAGT